ncbi:MAG: MraY family glycosyltransferase, partial [Planctomycetota bacterium]
MIKRFLVLLFALALLFNGTFFLISPKMDMASWIIFLGWSLFLISFLLSFLLTPLVLKMALKINFVDRPQGRKSHERVTPLGGGIAIFCSVNLLIWGGVFFGYLLEKKLFPSTFMAMVPQGLLVHTTGILSVLKRMSILLLGGTCLFITGLIDDRFRIRAKSKLMVQMVVAIFLVFAGFEIQFFSRYWYLSYPITILWIVGITNAFNLLDNMDGLSSGVVFICSLNFLMVCLNTKQLFVGALL